MAKYVIDYVELIHSFYPIKADSKEEAEKKFKELFFDHDEQFLHARDTIRYSSVYAKEDKKQEDEEHGKGN